MQDAGLTLASISFQWFDGGGQEGGIAGREMTYKHMRNQLATRGRGCLSFFSEYNPHCNLPGHHITGKVGLDQGGGKSPQKQHCPGSGTLVGYFPKGHQMELSVLRAGTCPAPGSTPSPTHGCSLASPSTPALQLSCMYPRKCQNFELARYKHLPENL